MKKIRLFFTAISLFVCLSLSAQERLFFRAHTMAFLIKNPGGEYVTSKEADSNVLVEIVGNKIIIYSAKQQVYRISASVDEDPLTSTYEAIDADGVTVVVGVAPIKDTNDIIVFVRYPEFCWYYLCTRD